MSKETKVRNHKVLNHPIAALILLMLWGMVFYQFFGIIFHSVLGEKFIGYGAALSDTMWQFISAVGIGVFFAAIYIRTGNITIWLVYYLRISNLQRLFHSLLFSYEEYWWWFTSTYFIPLLLFVLAIMFIVKENNDNNRTPSYYYHLLFSYFHMENP